MALGKRKAVQQPLFVTVADLNVRANPFYDAVNRVLDAHHFDTFAEGLCAWFYDDGERGGRPGLAPGIYFRSLMVGYFEGIESERGIDWRCNDSNSLKLFLGVAIDEPAPDHSTISRTRRLIDLETHQQAFSSRCWPTPGWWMARPWASTAPRRRPTRRCGASSAATAARDTRSF